METYIGVKVIKAKPMTRQEYNDYRGWILPQDESGSDEGMLVEYVDGGKANHPGHEGYISWSPLDVFDRAYKKSGNMPYGFAVQLAKAGFKIARNGWNGKGMWIIYVPGTKNITPKEGTPYHDAGLTDKIEILPHFDMYTVNAQGRRAMLCGWAPSQTDMDQEDWYIVN